MKESAAIIWNNKNVLWLTVFFTIFNSLVWAVNWFVQPYFVLLNIPVFYFGFLFAFFNIISAFMLFFAHQLKEKMQFPYVLISIAAVSFMFFLGKFPHLYLVPLWAFLTVFTHINHVFVLGDVLRIVPSDRAATILSFQNFFRRIVYVMIGPVLGLVSDRYGVANALTINALALFLFLSLTFLMRKRLSVSFS